MARPGAARRHRPDRPSGPRGRERRSGTAMTRAGLPDVTEIPAAENAPDPTRLTPRLRAILAVVLLADILDLMDSTITTIAARRSPGSSAGESHLSSGSGLATPWPWRVACRRGSPRRPLWQAPGVSHRHDRIHGCLGHVRPVRRSGDDHRGQAHPGGLRCPHDSQGISILMTSFSRPQFPRAVSAFGPAMGVSAILGPIAAGFIISANIGGLDWRPVFLINIILGLVGLLAAFTLLPVTGPSPARRSTPSARCCSAPRCSPSSRPHPRFHRRVERRSGREPGRRGAAFCSLRRSTAAGPNPLIVPRCSRTEGSLPGCSWAWVSSPRERLAYVISLFFQLVPT